MNKTHAIIAGSLFDFMGWLTSRKERIVLSSTDEASPAVEAITEFAKMRGLLLDNAQVKTWQESLTRSEQEPVAWHYPNGKADQCTTDKEFAELIVVECINICGGHARDDGTAQRIIEDIKKYFGGKA